jgi:hypothetical protein
MGNRVVKFGTIAPSFTLYFSSKDALRLFFSAHSGRLRVARLAHSPETAHFAPLRPSLVGYERY